MEGVMSKPILSDCAVQQYFRNKITFIKIRNFDDSRKETRLGINGLRKDV
jgi:hypothetical protein